MDEVMLGSSVCTYACVIGNAIGPRLKNGWPNAYTLFPITSVTVPVAPMLKSPLRMLMPTAEPGRSGMVELVLVLGSGRSRQSA